MLINMATFVEELNTLFGNPLTTTLTMSGAVRVKLAKQIPWAPLRQLLADHDKEMTLVDGVATFVAIPEAAVTGVPLPEPSKVVSAGPVVSSEYEGLSCTSADLNLAADAVDVLRVLVGLTVTVERIKPSDIKDGLHHLHRRGKVKPTKPHGSKRGCARSSAAMKAKSRLNRRTTLYRKAIRYLGMSG